MPKPFTGRGTFTADTAAPFLPLPWGGTLGLRCMYAGDVMEKAAVECSLSRLTQVFAKFLNRKTLSSPWPLGIKVQRPPFPAESSRSCRAAVRVAASAPAANLTLASSLLGATPPTFDDDDGDWDIWERGMVNANGDSLVACLVMRRVKIWVLRAAPLLATALM